MTFITKIVVIVFSVKFLFSFTMLFHDGNQTMTEPLRISYRMLEKNEKELSGTWQNDDLFHHIFLLYCLEVGAVEHTSLQSDGEAPVMLELWGMQSTFLLPLLSGPHWAGVVAPGRVVSQG